MSIRLTRAVALAAVLSTLAGAANAAEPTDPVVATVNGASIHRSDLLAIQQSVSQQQGRAVPLESNYDAFLRRAISDRLILDQANKQKLADDADVKKVLAEARDSILVRAWIAKTLRKAESDVTDAAAKARFDELIQKWEPREQVKVAHILVDSEEAAKAVIADLKAGANWDEEAKSKSKDGSRDKGGEIDWIYKDSVVPEFGEAAFKLKVGETTPVPVKTQFGWHVIKVEDKRMAPPPTFDEAKGQIRAQLGQEAVGKMVEDMQKPPTKITKFKLDGSPADAPAKP